ncbi:MAG: hypothetical protein ACTSYO_00425, partial [Candidatus Ranarchaeia archaeon]
MVKIILCRTSLRVNPGRYWTGNQPVIQLTSFFIFTAKHRTPDKQRLSLTRNTVSNIYGKQA